MSPCTKKMDVSSNDSTLVSCYIYENVLKNCLACFSTSEIQNNVRTTKWQCTYSATMGTYNNSSVLYHTQNYSLVELYSSDMLNLVQYYLSSS